MIAKTLCPPDSFHSNMRNKSAIEDRRQELGHELEAVIADETSRTKAGFAGEFVYVRQNPTYDTTVLKARIEELDWVLGRI